MRWPDGSDDIVPGSRVDALSGDAGTNGASAGAVRPADRPRRAVSRRPAWAWLTALAEDRRGARRLARVDARPLHLPGLAARRSCAPRWAAGRRAAADAWCSTAPAPADEAAGRRRSGRRRRAGGGRGGRGAGGGGRAASCPRRGPSPCGAARRAAALATVWRSRSLLRARARRALARQPARRHRRAAAVGARVKLRCGGATAEAFPPVGLVALVIASCRHAGRGVQGHRRAPPPDAAHRRRDRLPDARLPQPAGRERVAAAYGSRASTSSACSRRRTRPPSGSGRSARGGGRRASAEQIAARGSLFAGYGSC